MPRSTKLPKINLPFFSGNQIEWTSFWDIFNQSIHTDPNIQEVEKLIYLRGQLKGDAFRLISSYPIEVSTYPIVIALLKNTYGEAEHIKLAHTLDFFKIPEIKHTAQDLAEFRASMDQHTIALDNHNLSIKEFQTISLYTKLPHSLRVIFKRDLGADLMNYDVFAAKVTKEMANLNLSERVNSGQTYKKQPLASIASYGVQTNQRQNLNKKGYANTKSVSCILCNQAHYWSVCSTYGTPEGRRERAQSLGLCFLCLNSDHAVDRCQITTRFRCVNTNCYLKGIHNVFFCGNRPTPDFNNQSQGNVSFKSVTRPKVSHNKNTRVNSSSGGL